MLRDFIVALSLSNLWFLDVWRPFLVRHFTSYPYYHWKANPAPILLATMLDVLVLSAVLWLAISIARRPGKESLLKIARFVFVLIFLLVAVNILVLAVRNPPLRPILSSVIKRPKTLFEWGGINTAYSWLSVLAVLLGGSGLAVALHSLIFRRQWLIKMSVTFLLITSPFILITFAQAGTQWLQYRTGEAFRESAAPRFSGEGRTSRRVLWLIFDELDLRLAFTDRPTSLELPVFDQLRQESIFAQNAYPPGTDTETSIPALINGQLVSRINRTTPNELMLTLQSNKQVVGWSTQPNVFSRAREINLNSGLVGWYHPYCRIIGNSLTECSWEAASLLVQRNSQISDLIAHSNQVSLLRTMTSVARSLLLHELVRIVFPGEDPSIWRQHIVEEFKSIHQKSLEAAVDPALHLIFIHYPIPHPPGLYNRSLKEFSFSSQSGYLDNLALADRVLRELRDEMEKAQLWDSTTVLISSDHSLRADLWRQHPFWDPSFTNEDPIVRNSTLEGRVPFILKLAGESEGLIYEPAFNTVLSQGLLLAVLSGEVSRNQEVINWLDRHR